MSVLTIVILALAVASGLIALHSIVGAARHLGYARRVSRLREARFVVERATTARSPRSSACAGDTPIEPSWSSPDRAGIAGRRSEPGRQPAQRADPSPRGPAR